MSASHPLRPADPPLRVDMDVPNVRETAAIAAMQALIGRHERLLPRIVAEQAVEFADELVRKLWNLEERSR